MTTEEMGVSAPPGSPTDWRSRSAPWFPWAVVGVLAAVVVGTLVITDNNPAEPPYPSDQLDNPIAPWVFSYVFPVVWLALLVFFSAQLVRTRTFSMPALLFLAGTTMFWIEWPADWGSYLAYNREFLALPGWTSTWYQTYWKPVGVFFGYGVFFAVECIVLLKVVPPVSAAVQRAPPGAQIDWCSDYLVHGCVLYSRHSRRTPYDFVWVVLLCRACRSGVDLDSRHHFVRMARNPVPTVCRDHHTDASCGHQGQFSEREVLPRTHVGAGFQA